MSEKNEENSWAFTVGEAAKKLHIGRNLAYEGVRTGEIPSVRIGNRILVPCTALKNMLNSKSRLHGGGE